MKVEIHLYNLWLTILETFVYSMSFFGERVMTCEEKKQNILVVDVWAEP